MRNESASAVATLTTAFFAATAAVSALVAAVCSAVCSCDAFTAAV